MQIHTMSVSNLGDEPYVSVRRSHRDSIRKFPRHFAPKAKAVKHHALHRLDRPFQIGGISTGVLILVMAGLRILFATPVKAQDGLKATEIVYLSGNLDVRMPEIPEGSTAGIDCPGLWRLEGLLFDSLGLEHLLRIDMAKVPGQQNRWHGRIRIDPQLSESTNEAAGLSVVTQGSNSFIVEFDNRGTLLGIWDSSGNVSDEGMLILITSFDVQGATPSVTGSHVRQTFELVLGIVGSSDNSVTQVAEPSSLKISENRIP